ncbi:hypothetical protein cand_014870 [Cryptosporidium andersoni]|uniref:Uncharacterized protein n=1 Tax=Cryptosporidium andersoni TaxID=117008 RepID=A0A1J4MUC2_9CRYT|nr:hypothetical protein cand_014870 [Cryptosporidium andersoni]
MLLRLADYMPGSVVSRRDGDKRIKKAVIVAITSSIIFTIFLILRYKMVLRRSYEEQKLTLFSESAFYYSFYEDIINSPTIYDGIYRLLKDNRSEYPDVINALSRFNIFQELLLGIIYRLLYGDSGIANHWSYKPLSPFNFYYYVVHILMGLGIGILCGFCTYTTNSYLAGFSSLGFLFANFQERLLMRLSSIPLRENFGLPFVWGTICVWSYILDRNIYERNYNGRKSWILMWFCSVLLIQTWQFSVFILSTQLASTFATYILGYPIYNLLIRLIICHLLSLFTGIALQFGSYYLLMSPLLQVGLAILASVLVPMVIRRRFGSIPHNFIGSESFSAKWSFVKLIVAIFVFTGIRLAIIPFAVHDSHVFDILKSIFSNNQHTFDSIIYRMGGSEFSWVTIQQLKMIHRSGLFYIFFASLLTIIITIFSDIYKIYLLQKYFVEASKMNQVEILALSSDPDKITSISISNTSEVPMKSSGTDKSDVNTIVDSIPSPSSILSDWKSCDDIDENVENESEEEREDEVLLKNIEPIKQVELGRDKKTELNISKDLNFVLNSCLAYNLFQVCCFCFLGMIISRLRVLALPYMSVIAGFLASKQYIEYFCSIIGNFGNIYSNIPKNIKYIETVTNTQEDSKDKFQYGQQYKSLFKKFILLLSTTFILSYSWKRWPIEELRAILHSEDNATSSKSRLVSWLNTNIPSNSSIASDMTIGASIRLMTNFNIVLHPQYEDPKIRKRTQFMYWLTGCAPIKDIYDILWEEYKTNYIVTQIYRCSSPSNAPHIINAFDVASYLDNSEYRCKGNIVPFQRGCWRIQLDNYQKYFKMIYRNSDYTVFERRNEADPFVLMSRRSNILTPPHLFPYKRKLLDWEESWKPWIKSYCQANDNYCAMNIVDYARNILDIYGIKEVTDLLYKNAIELYPENPYVLHHYAEYMDFDLGKSPQEVIIYYMKALELSRPNHDLKILMDVVLFIDQSFGRSKSLEKILKLILEDNSIKSLVSLDISEIDSYLLRNKMIDVSRNKSFQEFVYSVCMVASFLKALIISSELEIYQTSHNIWQAIVTCNVLWDLSLSLDPNNRCVLQYWELFNNKKRSTMDDIYYFLFG